MGDDEINIGVKTTAEDIRVYTCSCPLQQFLALHYAEIFLFS